MSRTTCAPDFQDDARLRKWNWGYVDARDVAQCCRLGLEANIQGDESFIVALPIP
jgi:hypothetical protein